MSDGAGRLKDRLASGGEPADDAEILAAGDDPTKLTEVCDRADKNVLTQTQEGAKDLRNEHLTDEQKAAWREALVPVQEFARSSQGAAP